MTRLLTFAALLLAACAPRASAPSRTTDQPFTLGRVVVTNGPLHDRVLSTVQSVLGIG